MQNNERQDVYNRITGKIISSLEQGFRPWIKPWSADNAACRIVRPSRSKASPKSTTQNPNRAGPVPPASSTPSHFSRRPEADIRIRRNRAYCANEPDYLAMPPIESFTEAQSYYATLAHETTHWTQHASRLERDFGRKAWATKATPARNSWESWVQRSCAAILS